jgi:CRP-like cAMP-binding protein
MDDLERVLRAHPFLSDLEPEHVRFLVGCAKNVRYRAGEYVTKEGDQENDLYLIRQGTVSIEMPSSGGEAIAIETLGPGDVLGVSCLTPHPEHLDARARDTVLAFALDPKCLKDKMVADPRLGHALAMRLLDRTYERLSRARLQRLDVYR